MENIENHGNDKYKPKVRGQPVKEDQKYNIVSRLNATEVKKKQPDDNTSAS